MTSQPDDEDFDEEMEIDEGISLEELSQTYATVLAQSDTEVDSDDSQANEEQAVPSGLELYDPSSDPTDDVEDSCPVTPRSIIEAILFVGRPDSRPIHASEIANLMRGVSESEVTDLVSQLNAIYEETGSAMRIEEAVDGFRAVLADDLSHVRDQFYGRVKEVALNQAAIDCLALIAYQPGISRSKLEDQRGQPSGGVLNQLVRRQLIEMRREGDESKPSPHYYPTEKLVQLAGLGSLDDLPQVEEFE